MKHKTKNLRIKLGSLYRLQYHGELIHTYGLRIYGDLTCGSFIRFAKDDEIFAVLKKRRWRNYSGGTTNEFFIISALDGCTGWIEVNARQLNDFWTEIL